MYGERSSERVNVRVVLHIHFPIIVDVLLDRDVFVCLATGMGVTLLSRFFLPWAFDARWEEGQRAKRCLETFCPFSSVSCVN